jgi:hypothetical protein
VVVETHPLRLKETFSKVAVQAETSKLDQAYLLYKTLHTVVLVVAVVGALAVISLQADLLVHLHTADTVVAVVLTGVAQVVVVLVMVQQVVVVAVVDTMDLMADAMDLAVEALVSLVQLELLKRSQYNEKIRIH